MLYYSICTVLATVNQIKGLVELDDTKIEIENAGCPFTNLEQLLQKNICLMPDYHKNEPPSSAGGITNVNIDWRHVPQVLEVEEKKNLVTIQMRQHMEWLDPRIKVNVSAMKNMKHPEDWMKFFPSTVDKIWHPNLDMHTFDLQDWKSLFHPLWFQAVGMNKCPLLTDCKDTPDSLNLYADKQWKITLFCKFHFPAFPFDIQRCRFRQRFESTSDVVKIFIYPPSAATWRLNVPKEKRVWNYVDNGYEILILPIGELISFKSEAKNSSGSDYGFDIELRRLVQPYLFQYYFPSAALVVVSHVSFIVPLSSSPARVALVVTQFLTLTNIFIYQMVGFQINPFSTWCISKYSIHLSMQ